MTGGQRRDTVPKQKYALLGWPVRHSASPRMQGAAFAALGISATYELMEVAPEDLRDAVEKLRATRFDGWNVTVPHKEAIKEFIDDVDSNAAACGSINTVVNRDGRLYGYSTDGHGLATAVHESFGVVVAGSKFVFVGTGGAARATAVYVAGQGARELVLVNRTVTKAEKIAESIRTVAPDCTVTALPLADVSSICVALAGAAVVVQATSLGLHDGDPSPLSTEVLHDELAVMDMIYRDTPFLRGARERGCRTADGRGMLLHQGALSFQLWTGLQAPVEAMRRALHMALDRRGTEA